MDNEKIEKILWSTKIGRKYFLGCFCSSKIPNIVRYPAAMIVNEDRCGNEGTHWVAMYIKNPNSITYFDSYGNEPIEPLHKFLKDFDNIEKNTIPFQSPLSSYCAHYCIYFVYFICIGTPFKTIIDSLSYVQNPDSYVYNFVIGLYNSNKM